MSQKVTVTVTFLTQEEGGRSDGNPACLAGNRYRPALVLQDPLTRDAAPTDEYFGVMFDGGPPEALPGRQWIATVTPIIATRDILPAGTTFTIREGKKIVGYGTVNGFV